MTLKLPLLENIRRRAAGKVPGLTPYTYYHHENDFTPHAAIPDRIEYRTSVEMITCEVHNPAEPMDIFHDRQVKGVANLVYGPVALELTRILDQLRAEGHAIHMGTDPSGYDLLCELRASLIDQVHPAPHTSNIGEYQ